MTALRKLSCLLAVGAGLLTAAPPLAAEALDGRTLPLFSALPFAGILLSIALGPLLAAHAWHAHYGKVAAFWGALTLGFVIQAAGPGGATTVVAHVLTGEYLPFVLMLFSLFTAAGGIVIRGRLPATPVANTALLAFGTLIASAIGTTGAAMVLIRPLLRANAARKYRAHVAIFFIFLVGNIGGALSPLGDPPLFLGFLRGVDFFWPLRNLWEETLAASLVLLAVFFALDTILSRREFATANPPASEPFAVTGLVNLLLIGVVVAAIVTSGVWRPHVAFDIAGAHVELQNLLREVVMVAVGLASLALTPKAAREANGFEWGPIVEVAKLFAAIFLCIAPVLAMLDAGAQGPFGAMTRMVAHADGAPDNMAYFWLTGLLSSVLDNAPTYLVFFELAGGNAAHLTGPMTPTLAAISLGAVYMGALTYIGNAPNFMVYSIARREGLPMPGFFGYMLWSGAILLPLFAVMSWLFWG